MKLISLLTASAAASALCAAPAFAQESAEARIARLEASLASLQAELAELKAARAADAAAAVAPPPPAPAPQPAAKPSAPPTTLALKDGRPTFSTADGRFSVSLRGVMQFDGAVYDQDAPGPLATDFRRGSFGDATENEHARDLSDGFNFRRVRFGIEGVAFRDFRYNFTYDFGGSGVESDGKLNAAWIQYDGLGFASIRTGAYAPTTGLEDAASNTSSLFSERPAVAELVRGLAGGDARMALGVTTRGERWTLAGALTGNVAGVQTYDEQSGFVGRATFAPIKADGWLVHVGGTANLIFTPAASGPGGAATPVRLRERPELRVDGTRLVDTGSIDADSVTALGAELGVLHGPAYLQAEYFDIDIERRASALPDPSFSGWYVQGGWVLTGEGRRYNDNAGFDGIKPARPFDLKAGTWGAWELAARWSVLDLNYLENALPAAGSVRGGRQEILSLGVNWYLQPGLSLQGSYRRVSVDRLSPGGTAFGGAFPATPPLNAQVGQDIDILTLRTQYAF